MIVSAFGSGFSQSTEQAASNTLPVTLAGTSVEVDDGTRSQPAPLYFVSPGQVNFQLPFDVIGPNLTLRVRNASGVSDAATLKLIDRVPRFFTAAMDGRGDILAFHADFSRVSAGAPAQPGETLIAYVSGLGAVAPTIKAGEPGGDGVQREVSRVPETADVIVGEYPAEVQYAGLAPGFAGVYQINFVVPEALSGGNHPAVVAMGGQRSQPDVTLAVAGEAAGRQYYAAPDGTSDGDGSIERPWDLATALNHPGAVRPGDTIWLRGGTYGNTATVFRSKLTGTAAKPIIVRQYRNERATIDGGLEIHAPHTWYWGFEVTNSRPGRKETRKVPDCIGTYEGSRGVRLINLVLHDCNQGIGFWKFAENAEAYGNLIFHNGYQGDTDTRGHGHGIYTQNENGTKVIADNIIFNQFGLGIQAYGSENAFVRNYNVEGNIIFNNGVLARNGGRVDNILFAVGSELRNITIQDNVTYHTPEEDNGYSELNWQWGGVAENVVSKNNYWIGGNTTLELWNWNNVLFTGNTVYSAKSLTVNLMLGSEQDLSRYLWDNNTYYGSGIFRFKSANRSFTTWKQTTGLDARSTYTTGPPTGVWTIVRGNKYESGRGHIAIYNWDLKESVDVDVSSVLSAGSDFEIRDAQNFFGAPLVEGKLVGKTVTIPMSGLKAAEPVGPVPTMPKHTGLQFGAFVILKK